MMIFGPEVVAWVAARTGEFGNYGAAVGIGVARVSHDPASTFERREIIGGVVFNEWNGVSMCMHTAAVPKSGWLTRHALRIFFDYPFNQAKVKTLIALVGENNRESQRLVEGVGFTLFTEIPDSHPDGAMLIYTMLRDNCQWIKGATNERLAA